MKIEGVYDYEPISIVEYSSDCGPHTIADDAKPVEAPRPRQPRRRRRYSASKAASGESISGEPEPSFLPLVAQYAERGLSMIPMAVRTKAPTTRGWPDKGVSDFEAARKIFERGDRNLGVVLGERSGGTVDVDIDCDEARDLAHMLPPTRAIFGRPSNPSSHRLYRVEGPAPTVKFADPFAPPDEAMILEVRGDGGVQTVFPPSLHPSGESIQWVEFGEFAPVSYAELVAAAGCIAAEVVIRRHGDKGRAHPTVRKWLGQAVEPAGAVPAVAGKIVPRSRQAASKPLLASSGGSPFFRAVNDAALANLAAWVPALFPRAEFQSGTGAFRVKPEMLGRDCEEDLSIAPNGIVDFGVHDMGDARAGKRTPIDIVMQFGGAPNAVEAARWLCGQLGVDPASLGWRDDDADLAFEVIPPGRERFGPENDEDIGPEGTAEFIEWVVERAKVDAGAPFEVVTLDRLRSVREEDAATWQRLRARLKREARIGVVALDEALDGRHERQKKSYWPGPKSCTEWLDHAKRDDDGRLLSNLENVMAALRHAPEVASAFAYDEMACAVFVMQPLPRVKGGGGVAWTKPGRLTDQHCTQVQEWLQAAGLSKVGGETVRAAIDLRAREEGRSFHPVRDYLDTVRWDGKPRIGAWLTDYLGVESTPYTAAVGRMFLIAMVARIYEPGCKVDHTLILEGAQGVSKSTLCAALAGEWFSDSLPDITSDKECSQHLRGKWLIEIAELAAMSRAAANHLKSFLTRRVEQYRPSYGRNEVIEPRQCVFVGTTNDKSYLKDPTGGRRFWPVRVGDVLLHEEIRADRDLLFAEAVVAYKAGEPWWPERDFEASHMAAEQQARVDVDAWFDPIADWLATQKPGARVRLVDVANGALGLDTARFGKPEQTRVKEVLQNLGWERHAKRRDGYPVWQKTLPKGMPSEI